MNEILDTVFQGLLTIITALISIGITYAVSYIKLKVATIKDKNAQEVLNNTIDNLTNLTQKAVVNIEETTGKELKKAVADGVLSRDELFALKDEVIEEVEKSLTDESKATLSNFTNDLKTYIGYLVEESVKEIKEKK